MKRVFALTAVVGLLVCIGCSKQAVPVAPQAGSGVAITLADGDSLAGPAVLRLSINGADFPRITHESNLPGPGAYVRQFFVPPGANRIFAASLITERTTAVGGKEWDLSHLAGKLTDIIGGEIIGLEMRALRRMEVQSYMSVDFSANVVVAEQQGDLDYTMDMNLTTTVSAICYLGKEGVARLEQLLLIPSPQLHPERFHPDAIAAKMAANAPTESIEDGDWFGVLPEEPGSRAWVRVKAVGDPILIDYIYVAQPGAAGDGGTINP